MDKTKKSWENTRWETFLGKSTEIGGILGKELRIQLLEYLTTKGDAVNTLDYPYIVDMSETLFAQI
jgi:hypothetical protein